MFGNAVCCAHPQPTPSVFGLRIKGVDSLQTHFGVFSSKLAQLQTVNCLDGLSDFICKSQRVQQKQPYTITELFMCLFTKQYYLKQRDQEFNLERYLSCSTLRPVRPAEAQKQGMADNSCLWCPQKTLALQKKLVLLLWKQKMCPGRKYLGNKNNKKQLKIYLGNVGPVP